VVNNKIQVVYRLSDRITLMWPVRPNDSNATSPTSYNVYWDTAVGGGFTTLLVSVDNGKSPRDSFGVRSYANKVVVHITPSLVPGWNNDVTNYVLLKPVTGLVEGSAEAIIPIVPYTTGNMRLHYPELQRFIPVSVNADGKLITTP
jgi:hypothetical protein